MVSVKYVAWSEYSILLALHRERQADHGILGGLALYARGALQSGATSFCNHRRYHSR
jgi:hypothetical protein